MVSMLSNGAIREHTLYMVADTRWRPQVVQFVCQQHYPACIIHGEYTSHC